MLSMDMTNPRVHAADTRGPLNPINHPCTQKMQDKIKNTWSDWSRYSKTWLLVSKLPMIAGGTEMQRCEIQVINS